MAEVRNIGSYENSRSLAIKGQRSVYLEMSIRSSDTIHLELFLGGESSSFATGGRRHGLYKCLCDHC